MSTKDVTDVMVCQAYADYTANRGSSPYPYELLQQRTGECFKVCWRAMERALARGYIEYGVNLRSGWLTEKGLALLGRAAE